jgi:penicillin-binding protein 1C
VQLDFELRDRGLLSVLRQAGVRDARRDGIQAGLSAILGAYPVSMEELAELYAMLASGGRMRPIRFLETDPVVAGKPVLSAGACYLISEMLAANVRPDLPLAWEWTVHRTTVAFKTGTSYGFRDAWAAAYTPAYTAVVWLGNADARGVPDLRARETAAPPVFEILNHLTREKDEWFHPPSTVVTRQVCAVTGQVPGPWCPRTVPDLAIAGVSDVTPCRVHQRIFVRKSDGKEVCWDCMTGPASAYATKILALWPPDMAQFLRTTGRACDLLPPHNPRCPGGSRHDGPRIASPAPGGEYRVAAAIPASAQRLTLHARDGSDAHRLWWYVGGELVANGEPATPCFWTPQPGSWEVRVEDELGRSDRVHITVLRGPAVRSGKPARG